MRGWPGERDFSRVLQQSCLPSSVTTAPTQTSTPQESDRKGALYAQFQNEEADAVGNGDL